ncbi:AB-hydrolase YheT [Martensiomyces pterosporus]|nr:AB-hydrolase YheT [Martensiomyces pterosporus]
MSETSVKLIAADSSYSRILGVDSSNRSITFRSLVEFFCPSLTDPQKSRVLPTPYLFSGMMQTVYSGLISGKRDQYTDIQYDRELRVMDDGGTVSLDWYPNRDSSNEPSDEPIAILMAGFCGSSEDYHVRYLAKALADSPLGYRVVVKNHRGCCRTPLTAPEIINIHSTCDFRAIVGYLGSCNPAAPLVAVGFSLGANVLTKYLGEEGEECPLAAAVTICGPFDVLALGRSIDGEGLINRMVVQRDIVGKMQRYLKKHEEAFQSGHVQYDMDAIMKTTTMAQIGNLVPVKELGFNDVWEYYAYASSSRYIDNIAIPFLAINSIDDPVTTVEGIPIRKFGKNPNIALALVKHGGHLGFFTGVRPRIWYTAPVMEFFAAMTMPGICRRPESSSNNDNNSRKTASLSYPLQAKL